MEDFTAGFEIAGHVDQASAMGSGVLAVAERPEWSSSLRFGARPFAGRTRGDGCADGAEQCRFLRHVSVI